MRLLFLLDPEYKDQNIKLKASKKINKSLTS